MLNNNYFNYKFGDFENPIPTTMIKIIDLYDSGVFFLILILWFVIVVFCISSYYVYFDIIFNSQIILFFTSQLPAWYKNRCNRAKIFRYSIKAWILKFGEDPPTSPLGQFMVGVAFIIFSIVYVFYIIGDEPPKPSLIILVIETGLRHTEDLMLLLEREDFEDIFKSNPKGVHVIVVSRAEWNAIWHLVREKMTKEASNPDFAWNRLVDNFTALSDHARVKVLIMSEKAVRGRMLTLLGFEVFGYTAPRSYPT